MKYGSEKELRDYYSRMISAYNEINLEEISNELMFISFNKYNKSLSNEEICTFVNYMWMVSANNVKIMELIEMSIDDLKNELKKYLELGF